MIKPSFLLLIFLIPLLGLSFLAFSRHLHPKTFPSPIPSSSSPSPLPLEASGEVGPTPSPTPKPLSFAQMSALYGPCVTLPTLMYHHIQNPEDATVKHQSGLTVNPDTLRSHLDYLRSHGYNPIAPADLVALFNSQTPLPSKPVLLTFDDAYADFSAYTAPLLQEFSFKATVFTPTGLVDNPDYLSWNDISRLAGTGLFHFANHTWSHRNVAGSPETIEREISLADTQLTDRNLNQPKIFAYPYGFPSATAEKILQNLGYQLAFTTQPGRILCTKQRLTLPRIRIGNSSLQNYGL